MTEFVAKVSDGGVSRNGRPYSEDCLNKVMKTFMESGHTDLTLNWEETVGQVELYDEETMQVLMSIHQEDYQQFEPDVSVCAVVTEDKGEFIIKDLKFVDSDNVKKPEE